jgi:hypothetical protein
MASKAASEQQIICDFFSDLALIERATHYRSQEGRKNDKSPPGPLSKIIHRDRCPWCSKTSVLKTDSGVSASFTTRHTDCILAGVSRLGGNA